MRAEMVAHLDTCGSCRREVSALTTVVDSISAITVPVDPSPGFVNAVLDAAAAADPGWGPVKVSEKPARVTCVQRPVAVVARRRRTVLALTGVTLLFAVLAAGSAGWALSGLAIFAAIVEVTYLGMVVAITHSKARAELITVLAKDDCWWRDFEPVAPPGSPAADTELIATPVVAVNNTDLARFCCSCFAGWLLAPVVGLIRLVRGDLAGIEHTHVLGAIVALQRRSRARSLHLLAAGATTVAVASGGAAVTMWIAPGMASAATAARLHTLGSQVMPEALAKHYGISSSYLAERSPDPPTGGARPAPDSPEP
jgi:hypothetical protein